MKIGRRILSAGLGRALLLAGVGVVSMAWLGAAVLPGEPAAPAGTIPPAEVLSVKNGEVVLRRDGKTYQVEMQALSPEDQAAARAWKPPVDQPQDAVATTDSEIEIKIAIGPVSQVSSKDNGPAQLAAKVSLSNKETRMNFKHLQGTLILVAQQPGQTTRYKVVALQKFSADVAAGQEYGFVGPVQDDLVPSLLPNRPEFAYVGYMFVLQNSDNNVIQFQRSGPFLRSGNEALKLAVGSVFTAPRSSGNGARRAGSGAARAGSGRTTSSGQP